MSDQARRESLALALSLNKPAALAAYAEAELRWLWGMPSTCWKCGAEVDDQAETCPSCGADLVPF